jgi:peptidoglycan/LPS O-acetylase OafA/YrhL
MFAEIPAWPFLIPIFAIIFGCGIAMVAIYTNYRKRRDIYTLHHRERMAAIEKGVEVPPLPEVFFTEDTAPYSPRRNLLKGLIWLFIGLGVLLALYQHGEEDGAWFGLIPMGIGAAYLIYYFVVGRKEAEALEAAEQAKLGETKPRSAV